MSTEPDRYEALYRGFRWHVPAVFNIAELCSARWARDRQAARRPAVIQEHEDGTQVQLSYGELQQAANRLSNALARRGVGEGDRVAIVMPQRCETAIAHIAVYQLGAVAVPLSMLFGPEALEYRLNDSGAVAAIVDAGALDGVRAVRPRCPALQWVIAAGAVNDAQAETAADAPAGELRPDMRWDEALAREAADFAMLFTHAEDAALLVYTSGTTGPPKGAVIPHRALVGNLSGFVCSQNWFPRPDDVFWSPADWAWTGGLMDALLPTLYFGRPIVAYAGRFGAERAFELMQRHRVTNSFLFPTALKAMMKAVPEPRSRYQLQLRAIMSAGEAVGDAVFAYCRDALGVTVNEMFGQTEMNYVVGNCGASLDGEGRPVAGWPARAGSMGRPFPGHRVAVLDDDGNECPRGTPGDVAVNRFDIHGHPDPVFFLGYWNNDEATARKYSGDWCRTGDTAVMDEAGYLWYQGRSDDVFKSAGYRIGPGEIENCLLKHPAVANAAVVPKPDAERGALVKAYVVLADGRAGDAALVEELQQHVRGRLAPYEYPKEIEFIDALPMTTTGKIQRGVLRRREEERAAGAGTAA
jgi:acetyl-CoA synthetase